MAKWDTSTGQKNWTVRSALTSQPDTLLTFVETIEVDAGVVMFHTKPSTTAKTITRVIPLANVLDWFPTPAP